LSELPLSQSERRAAREFITRVRRFVDAELVQASLFGSKARGSARSDSDVDILLVFRRLAWDREPHATHAEMIADAVARNTGIPITTWSVSLPDLERGARTPMLVDALEDSIPLWRAGPPIPPLPFTPEDALRCVRSLLERIAEGSIEADEHLRRGDPRAAALRVRDDLVRACTAVLLTVGTTRPRRGEVVAAYRAIPRPNPLPPALDRLLDWVRDSFGEDGRDAEAPVPPPPGGLGTAARAVDALRHEIVGRARRLEAGLPGNR
jgi:hypothetical protein